MLKTPLFYDTNNCITLRVANKRGSKNVFNTRQDDEEIKLNANQALTLRRKLKSE